MKNLVSAVIFAVAMVFGTVSASADDGRAARVMSLFTTYCVPDYSLRLGAKLRFNLEKVVQPTGDSPFWFDEPSQALLYVDKNRCTITTPRENPLDRADGLALKGLIETYVPARFPELEFEPDTTWGAPDLATAWMKGPDGSWERWGVFSFVMLEPGEGQRLSLVYVRHPDER